MASGCFTLKAAAHMLLLTQSGRLEVIMIVTTDVFDDDA